MTVRRWVLGLAVCGCVGCDTTSSSADLDGTTGAERLLRVTRFGSGAGVVRSTPAGILCAPECEADFADGETVELVAEPSPGSQFVGWGGDCAGSVPVCAVEMAATRVVSAQFFSAVSDAGVPADAGSQTSDAGVAIDAGGLDAGVRDAALVD